VSFDDHKHIWRHAAVAALLICLPPITWTATGIAAGWLASRQGKSWRWGFALGFFFSFGGITMAALPRRINHCHSGGIQVNS
jgi:hypothetical protein